jgi:hypothetical protein
MKAERPEHRCLSRSDLTRHQDETLLLLNTVNELGQRLPVIWREKEKLRVRRELKRLAGEPEELQEHATLTRVAGGRRARRPEPERPVPARFRLGT